MDRFAVVGVVGVVGVVFLAGVGSARADDEPVAGLFVGGTARYRDALGSRKEPVIRDGFAGATSTLALGHFAVTVMAGVAKVETQTARAALGPGATVALGAMF